MKILVPVKRVIDYNVKVRVKPDQSGVELNNVKMAMNPFCEIAIEEALRIKEAGKAEEVIAVSCGPKKCEETLRSALAMGADRAIHVETDDELEPLAIAKILKAIVGNENPGLVLTGKQAIDGDNNQTGQMLAALLGWPQATFVSELVIEGNTVSATREVDGGLEMIEVQGPTVATVDLRLNEPRYASLPAIMKAKKKPIDRCTPAELGVDTALRVKTIKVAEPPARDAGVIVASVDELVDKLKNEAKVI
ncbi:electron transfer flavoprotein subunit beta/FixA family protein [Gammaproteobacteria bacterium]|nr:electron transfer flavoprotein subunit beta/FixA family protein [Gammaproteobacteria bacterium]